MTYVWRCFLCIAITRFCDINSFWYDKWNDNVWHFSILLCLQEKTKYTSVAWWYCQFSFAQLELMRRQLILASWLIFTVYTNTVLFVNASDWHFFLFLYPQASKCISKVKLVKVFSQHLYSKIWVIPVQWSLRPLGTEGSFGKPDWLEQWALPRRSGNGVRQWRGWAERPGASDPHCWIHMSHRSCMDSNYKKKLLWERNL